MTYQVAFCDKMTGEVCSPMWDNFSTIEEARNFIQKEAENKNLQYLAAVILKPTNYFVVKSEFGGDIVAEKVELVRVNRIDEYKVTSVEPDNESTKS